MEIGSNVPRTTSLTVLSILYLPLAFLKCSCQWFSWERRRGGGGKNLVLHRWNLATASTVLVYSKFCKHRIFRPCNKRQPQPFPPVWWDWRFALMGKHFVKTMLATTNISAFYESCGENVIYNTQKKSSWFPSKHMTAKANECAIFWTLKFKFTVWNHKKHINEELKYNEQPLFLA